MNRDLAKVLFCYGIAECVDAEKRDGDDINHSDMSRNADGGRASGGTQSLHGYQASYWAAILEPVALKAVVSTFLRDTGQLVILVLTSHCSRSACSYLRQFKLFLAPEQGGCTFR